METASRRKHGRDREALGLNYSIKSAMFRHAAEFGMEHLIKAALQKKNILIIKSLVFIFIFDIGIAVYSSCDPVSQSMRRQRREKIVANR